MPTKAVQVGSRTVCPDIFFKRVGHDLVLQREISIDGQTLSTETEIKEKVKSKPESSEENVPHFKDIIKELNTERKTFKTWDQLKTESIRRSRAKGRDTKYKYHNTVIELGKQKFILIGTTHGVSGVDYTPELQPETLKDASIILEYPPLFKTTRTIYSDKDIGSVSDKTQAALAKLKKETAQSSLEFVGADGRKAFEKGGGAATAISHEPAMAISLRHVEEKKIEWKTQELAPTGPLITAARDYVRASLGLQKGEPEALAEGRAQRYQRCVPTEMESQAYDM